MSVEQDLLARMLRELNVLLAAVRGLVDRRQFAEASQRLGDAYRTLFGLDRRFLQMMQPAQVSAILVRHEKLRAFAQLMAEEANLLRLQGDASSAAATARWAVQIIEVGKVREDE